MSCLNAPPETVALAVLDACERAVRGANVDFDDPCDSDAKFMKSCVKAYASRLRVLKAQAAAGWKPEFSWMLERCHSIAIDDVDVDEKEGVRVEKMKCMACGRWEHCCKKAVNCAGPFDFKRFNEGDAGGLQPAWQAFLPQYEEACVGTPEPLELPACDYGEFTIGATCLRKAELFYACNTLLMECCYDTFQDCKDIDDFDCSSRRSRRSTMHRMRGTWQTTERNVGAEPRRVEDDAWVKVKGLSYTELRRSELSDAIIRHFYGLSTGNDSAAASAILCTASNEGATPDLCGLIMWVEQ